MSRLARLALVLLCVGIPLFHAGHAAAQDPAPSRIPGIVDTTGTRFEITDSQYLNVTVETADPVRAMVMSVPSVITLYMAPIEGTTQTQVTIRGLPPSATLHKYEDSFVNHVAFETDASGTYSFAQDLASPHFITIRETPGTIFLTPSGWSLPVGTWDPATQTGTLRQNVHETIEIWGSGITLDGAGYTSLTPGAYGVYRGGAVPTSPSRT